MKYRAEIDGLRAVAVIPVILFHAGFEYFRGGFVGVDVFFVISGYLITMIIISEKQQGSFSLLRFYERRARRILPALFLVMLVCLPFAWLWLWPSDLQDFSQSLIAVSFFASNILFWRESGYWGTANELKPLLHTWSLAVEEQYYILFPIFLLVLWQFRKRWVFAAFCAMAVISLGLAQWGAYFEPRATFFLLPTRGWELAIGAGLAFWTFYRPDSIRTLVSNPFVNDILGVMGLAMIGYSIYAFDETIPFPGFYALIPTLGTALILCFSSSQTFVGRLLGTKLLVGIGLISYSAYLWHQPLLAFVRYRSLAEPTGLLLGGVALLSLPLAYLSWRYVETPFRSKGRVSQKSIFAFAVMGSIAFGSIGLAGHLANGFEQRIGQNGLTAYEIEEKLGPNRGLDPICGGKFTLAPECRTSDAPKILLWGDSYAMHLAQGIIASNPDAEIIQMTKSSCGPFFNIAPVTATGSVQAAEECLVFIDEVREWLKANDSVKYAVVSSSFTAYLKDDISILLRNNKLLPMDFDLVAREFTNMLDELTAMGVTPIVFSPPPANGEDLGRCLARAAWVGLNLNECDFHERELSRVRLDTYRLLESIPAEYRVIRLDHLLCNDGRCTTHLDSVFLFRDEGHLSHEGSVALGKLHDFYGRIVADAP